ncbi:MAG: (Fe-S)-binding protein, partial [Planctomycetes bacterium]|nr:(Fe-S)-binding protein [Planctomycetota bacterium]
MSYAASLMPILLMSGASSRPTGEGAVGPALFAAIVVAGLLLFAWSMKVRLALMFKGAADREKRWNHLGERIRGLFAFGFGQQRMFKDLGPGLMHAFLFWAFCVLALRTLTMFVMGFTHDEFSLFLMFSGSERDHDLGWWLHKGYDAGRDFFLLAAFVMAGYALFRRVVTKPERLTYSWEGVTILLFILGLMVTDWVYDGSRMAIHYWPALKERAADSGIDPSVVDDARRNPSEAAPLLAGAIPGSRDHQDRDDKARALIRHAETAVFHRYMPVTAAVGRFVAARGLSDDALFALGDAAWWVHCLIILAFLNLLPVGKHFHVITALPNVFFRQVETPYGRLPTIKGIEEAEEWGVSRMGQFSWKQILDLYSCTECGRCSAQCPAWNTGKPLSPKQVSIDLRHHMMRFQESMLGAKGAAGEGEAGAPPAIPSNVISDDVLWSCTTCRACEEACPVFITYVDKIVQMRQHLVLSESKFPQELNQAFQGWENNGNPWKLPPDDRAKWTESAGVKVPTIEENPNFEYLYWVGCAGAYDDRGKKVAQSVAKILNAAGVNFAILGSSETCTGDSPRRLGHEYLFQMLAQQNVETLNQAGVKKIITHCPHCFNTFKN